MNQKTKVVGTFNNRSRLLSINTKINQFIVLSFLNTKHKDGSWLYKVKCSCGKLKELTRAQLKRTKSCGCFRVNRIRKEEGEVSLNVLYTTYKHRARKNNIAFDLSKYQFRELISKNCYYCNIIPKNYNTYVTDGNKSKNINQGSIDRAWVKVNGIDRINSDLGYTLVNCLTCCEHCNRAKLDWTFEEFLTKVKDIYEFLGLDKLERDALQSLRDRKKQEKEEEKSGSGWDI